MANRAAGTGKLEVRPLTPARADDVRAITASTWGAQCWDLWWRTEKPFAASGVPRSKKEEQRRAMLAKLARRRHAPVLVAYHDGVPVGFVSLGPRIDYERVAKNKTTQPVDDVAAWVIPCITVRKGHRGQGIALALLRAAIPYAAKHGAPAIEGFPRAEKKRFDDGSVFMGTPTLFRRAGFRQIRGVQTGLPRYYAPRVTMRASWAAPKKTSSHKPTRSRPAPRQARSS